MIVKNSLLNVIGTIFPAAVGFVAFPILLYQMGPEKFGVLSFIWMFVGYFGFLDLGIGRALTIYCADPANSPQLPFLIRRILKSLGLITVLFAVVSITAVNAFPYGVENLFSTLRGQQALTSLSLILATIPAVVLTSSIRGILESQLRFVRVNSMAMTVGSLNFILPCFISFFTQKMEHIILGLLVLRYMGLLGFYLLLPNPLRRPPLDSEDSGIPFLKILSKSGWMGFSSLLGVLITPMDRLIVSFFVPASQFGSYTISAEIVTRLAVFPSSLGRVLVPLHSAQVKEKSWDFQMKNLRFAGPFYLLVFLFAYVFSPDVFRIWLGANSSPDLVAIFRIMIGGFFFNSLSWHFFDFLQSRGFSKEVALAHLAQIPIYAMTLYLVASRQGLVGAAWVYFGRQALDFALLLYLGYKFKKRLIESKNET